MIIVSNYLPPSAIVITIKQPESREFPKLPQVVSVRPPVKDGPGGRTSGGSR